MYLQSWSFQIRYILDGRGPIIEFHFWNRYNECYHDKYRLSKLGNTALDRVNAKGNNLSTSIDKNYTLISWVVGIYGNVVFQSMPSRRTQLHCDMAVTKTTTGYFNRRTFASFLHTFGDDAIYCLITLPFNLQVRTFMVMVT